MSPDDGGVPHELADAEACLRRGDLDAALRLVAGLPPGPAGAAPVDLATQATRQRLRLRGALQYRLVEAPGLSAEAREEVRVILALGTTAPDGSVTVPLIVLKPWPQAAPASTSTTTDL